LEGLNNSIGRQVTGEQSPNHYSGIAVLRAVFPNLFKTRTIFEPV